MACEMEAEIAGVFARLVQHAEQISTTRCPYQDRLGECTARFACPNQRPQKPRPVPRCGGMRPC